MSLGYSLRLKELNEDANQTLLGVRLGALCIKHGVPASQVATLFGVTKQTIYNWFCGVTSPAHHLAPQVEKFLSSL